MGMCCFKIGSYMRVVGSVDPIDHAPISLITSCALYIRLTFRPVKSIVRLFSFLKRILLKWEYRPVQIRVWVLVSLQYFNFDTNIIDWICTFHFFIPS